MDATTQVISILVIVLALATVLITSQTSQRRKREVILRTIPAFAVLPDLVGLSVEANQPIHLSLGSSGLGGTSTLLTIATAEFFYQIAQRASLSDVSPIVTLSDASALSMAQDTLRRAYASRQRSDLYRYNHIRWYPSGSRSLAYAAALTSVMTDDAISSNVLVGDYGPELALIMDAGARRNLPATAVSTQLQGQAVAYAFSDYLLIGEEIFSAPSYLGTSAAQQAHVFSVDLLRWGLVLALFFLMLASLINRGG